MPSSRMTALLALLAVAGYQNRDRLGEMLGGITGQRPNNTPGGSNPRSGDQSVNPGGLGGLLGGLLGGSGAGGGGIAGGIGDLVETITKSGQGEVAKSWVQTGPNRELDTSQLESALGSETIEQLTTQTGLSRDELLSRLRNVLPTAVDKLTPEGRLPTEEETDRWRAL